MDRHVIPGSSHPELSPHLVRPLCHPDERFEVTLRTRTLTNDDIYKIHDFSQSTDLFISDINSDQGYVKLSGKASNHEKAFGVKLHHTEYAGGSHRSHPGPISVPVSLAKIVRGVFGLDDRPCAKPHFRLKTKATSLQPGTFTPPQVASIYGFPPGMTGAGQTIAIIELGGGYKLSQISAYLTSLGVTTPNITFVSVDGGTNTTDGPDGADGEVQLDVEIISSLCSDAKILVYFADNTDRAFMDAVSEAIAANVDIISISWGGPESSWTQSALASFDVIFQSAVSKGINVFVAAGDNGSSDGLDGNNVDFPGSSPNVCCCGGTYLSVNGSAITEVVWNDQPEGGGATGGGFSSFFPAPAYQLAQKSLGNKMRGVPDLASNASPESGFAVVIDGQPNVIGGTSASAPLMAAYNALLNQALGKNVPFFNSFIYRHQSSFRDIVTGNNGTYSAHKGYDSCTGVGVVTSKLFEAL